MKKFRGTTLFCLCLFVVIVVFVVSRGRISASLIQDDQNPAAKTPLPFAVRGQVIVKYKDTVTSCVHCVVRRSLSISHAVSGNGKGLDDLHSRYGVHSAKPVFRTIEEEQRVFGSAATISTESLKQHHRNKLNLHRFRYTTIAGRSQEASMPPDLHHVYVLQLSKDTNISSAVAEFSENPHVEYAQPNYLAEISLKPNDKYYRSSRSWGQPYDDLWALKQNQLNLAPAWDLSQGKGIVVAVVDTGLDYNHPDIAANVWSNPSDEDGNQSDDDANGFIDDHRGWDFSTCNEFAGGECTAPKEPDNDPFDGNFHGTHVSGTIAAVGQNKRGIIGVAPMAKIMPVKGLNDKGRGQFSDLSAAIVYAASNGADVINNSWGCGFCPRNPVVEDAVETAYKLGVVVVFSAGNDATNVRGKSPQNQHLFKPVVVSATNEKDRPTSFTNFGSTVDVAAPGGGIGRRNSANILSLRPIRCDECSNRLTVDDEYLRLAGTSMSAPHVSGLAALILAQRPTLKNEEVRQVLRSSAKDIERPGFDLFSGSGRINALQALDKTAPLRVSIEKPLHNSGAGPRAVSIRGTVTGPGLASYQLSYLSENLIDWIPIGGPRSASVNSGLLGSFPGANLPQRWHTIKLEATSQSGLRYEDVTDIAIHLPAKKILAKPRGASHDPDISGDLVVFSQDVVRGVSSHLIVYDLKTKRKKQITSNPIAFARPRISGNVITWLLDLDEPDDGVFYCVYNRQSGACPARTLSTNIATGTPSVSGKYIVWEEFENEKDTIYLYDISNDKKRVIGEGTNPDISGTDVVYKHVYPGRLSSDLFHYDIRTKRTKQLTNDFGSEFSPVLSGRNVAYMRNHIIKGRPPHFDIYLIDLDSGKETKLVEDPEGLQGLDFSGNNIVWRHTELESRVYDLNTGVIQPLSFFPVGLRNSPRTSEGTAVWILRDPEEQPNGDVYFVNLR